MKIVARFQHTHTHTQETVNFQQDTQRCSWSHTQTSRQLSDISLSELVTMIDV